VNFVKNSQDFFQVPNLSFPEIFVKGGMNLDQQFRGNIY